MTKIKKEVFQGFLVGLVAPVISFYFYVTLALKTEFVEAYHQLVKDDLFTQVLTISVLVNMLVFFVFYRRKEDYKARGVIGASIFYALSIVFMEIL